METRSAKAKKNVQRERGGSSTSTGLDENLWGNLQHHVDLARDVYPKLPFEEFFHLRTVCKDWYIVACKRLDLKELIHKPFFNSTKRSYDDRLEGILIYNALSRSWDWRSGWTLPYAFAFVLNEGAIFSIVASKGVIFSIGGKSGSNHANVFHWPSKIHQALDGPANLPSTDRKVVFGMTVSEKQGPLNSFKVVLGSPDFDTQVYESESGLWQTKPCRVPEMCDPWYQLGMGCVDCNGRVYITTQHTSVILVYDFGNAEWNSLPIPGERRHYGLDMLGVWDGRIFDVIWQFGPQKKDLSIRVWELVDETLHKWKVYDCMPKGFLSLYNKDVTIRFSFCRGFMLVYSWNNLNCLAGGFCLFNMATKNWQKLNIATRAIGINCG